MREFIKNNIKFILGTIVGLVIAGTGVYALTVTAGQITYDNSQSGLQANNVGDAIDKLYEKAESAGTKCPDGYKCDKSLKIIYNSNDGYFSNNTTSNMVEYSKGKTVSKKVKHSHSANVDDDGTSIANCYFTSPGVTDTVTIEGVEELQVNIHVATSTSYAYAKVLDKDGNDLSGTLWNANQTAAIDKSYEVKGDTVKFLFYDSAGTGSQANMGCYGYYATVLGYSLSDKLEILNGEYYKPITGDERVFIGWSENVDGSGNIYKNENEVLNAYSNLNDDITLYAQYSQPICKRAITLHKETCSNNSGSYYYCLGAGYKLNDLITYGNENVIDNKLSSGDAFDCDVNGDGVYDSTKERFYYISDVYLSGDSLNSKFNENYAALVYYSNTNNNVPSNSLSSYWYSSSSSTSYGPLTIAGYMPKTSGTDAWRDDLLISNRRNIYSSSGYKYTSNFSYEGKAARLLTYQELYKGCYDGTTSLDSSNSLNSKCQFLMENTKFASSSYSVSGSWLETPIDGSNAYLIYSYTSYVPYYSVKSSYGARPVIEVNKSMIDY